MQRGPLFLAFSILILAAAVNISIAPVEAQFPEPCDFFACTSSPTPSPGEPVEPQRGIPLPAWAAAALAAIFVLGFGLYVVLSVLTKFLGPTFKEWLRRRWRRQDKKVPCPKPKSSCERSK